MNEHDFIIIGGGVSGLSMGALLANKGKNVLILEKEKKIGGRAKLWKKDGFEVDYGIHLSRGAASSVFKELGMKLERKKHDLMGGFLIVDEKIPYNIIKDARFFLKNKVISISEISKSIRYFLATFLKNHNKYFDLSVGMWLKKLNASKNIKNLFQMICSILVICPYLDRISLGELVHVVKTMNLRGLARGSFKQIFTGLITKIKEDGGEIRRLNKVEKIIIDENKKKALGVVVNGEEIHAKHVILASPPEQIPKLIDKKFIDATFFKKIETIRPTAGIVIDYGLKQKISNQMGFFTRAPSIIGIFENEAGVPPGKQLLSFYMILNMEQLEDKKLVQEKTEFMEKFVKALYPNLEENILWRRVLNLRRIDGVELNTYQTIDKRIDNIFPNISNLFLIGDYTNAPGTGGDIAFNSALQCYKKLKKKKLI